MTPEFQHLCPTADARRIYSAGAVCELLQITFGQLVVLMDDADLKFVRMIDAVPYTDEAGLRAISAKRDEVLAHIDGRLNAARDN